MEIMQQQKQETQEGAPPHQNPAPPKAAPPSTRRPRVREVSSRFMSPAPVSSSSSSTHPPPPPLPNHQRSQSVQRRRHPHPPSSPLHSSDSESEPLSSSSSSNSILRSSCDTPLPQFHHFAKRSLFPSSNNTLHLHLHLKENGDPHLLHSFSPKFPPRNTNSRTDTPMAGPRLVQALPTPSTRSRGVAHATTTTAAAKLLHSTGLTATRRTTSHEEIGQIQRNNSASNKPSSASHLQHATSAPTPDTSDSSSSSAASSDTWTITSHPRVCNSPPIPTQNNKIPISELRSSMPDAPLFPGMSARLLAGDNSNEASFSSADSCSVAADSPCHRSLNSALSTSHNYFSPTKSVSRSFLVAKSESGPTRPAAICLPPNPSIIKSGMDTKKSRKSSNHQEDAHSLRILHNRHLQWLLANAKAEASMKAQKTEAEQSLYSVMAKISEMRESVIRKQVELEQLKRMERLSAVVNAQLPYLDEWAILEEDHSSCLSGAINSLNDCLTQLPVVGNVKVYATELSESLSSAINVLEAISPNVQSFLPKLQEVDHVISELAGVVARERALIEECGALLSKANILQVEECSLRGQLIQLKRSLKEL